MAGTVHFANPLPNLVILGSQKCGTSSLHECLAQHPDVHMSYPLKEPGYFLDDKHCTSRYYSYFKKKKTKAQILEQDMLRGYKGQKFFGESSTDYTLSSLKDPTAVAKRMKAQEISMKLIFIMRDPYERVLSFYDHLLTRRSDFELSFSEFLDSPSIEGVVRTSMYCSRLLPFANVLGVENFLLLDFHRFTNSQLFPLFMADVTSFLGVSEHSFVPVHANRSKATATTEESELRRQRSQRISTIKSRYSDMIEGDLLLLHDVFNTPIDLAR
jgi:hypothetical protein